MVTEQTRQDIWQAYLDLARLTRYYDALSDRHRRSHRVIQFLLLASASGGVITFLEVLPKEFQLVVSTAVAVLVVWDLIMDYSKKAALLHKISTECSGIEIRLSSLWNSVQSGRLTDEEARGENTELMQKVLEATRLAGEIGVPENKSLNRKCAAEAYEVMVARYVH